MGDAADEAAKAFNYEAGNPTFVDKAGHVLDRDKTLLEASVRDFDKLELTDKGWRSLNGDAAARSHRRYDRR